MNTQMISSICIALVGILLIILSILFFIKEKKLKKNCTSMVKGNVIKYKYLGSNNARSISPVVEYTVDGKKYNAYRHYKKIVSKNKYVLNNDESDNFFNEILFIFQTYKIIFYFIHIFYYKLLESGFSFEIRSDQPINFFINSFTCPGLALPLDAFMT